MKVQTHRSAKRTRRSAFSFAEVMFAVIVLGIGFIMVAAIFPVAISQTQSSLSDTAGVTVGRSGSIYMQALIPQGSGTATASFGNWQTYGNPADGNVHPIDDNLTLALPTRWDRLKGNFISTADPRFAWIPVGYKMANETVTPLGAANVARYAEFYLLAVQAQVRSTFDRTDIDPPGTPGAAPLNIANLRPKTVLGVNIQDSSDPANTQGVDIATFPAFPSEDLTPIAAGTYILVSNDHLDTSASPTNAKLMNGQYYRLGANLAPNVWELQPGNDFQVSPGADQVFSTGDDILAIPAADVLLVGRGYDDATAPTKYEGASMDIFMLPPVIVQLPVPPTP